jgi:hypothetical protein
VIPQSLASARLAAAREASNAARAYEARLGRAASVQPPPLYAYDPDIGRLAVTTPTYNTAIVTVSQRAFPYGGVELARLYDGDQEVAANIGGRGRAAFGLLVRDLSGRTVFSTQRPRTSLDRRVTPLRLTHAPAGTAARAWSRPGRAYAGAFRDVRAVGTATEPGWRAVVAHRFTAAYVDSRWVLRGAVRGRSTVDALFPSWGGAAARVFAVGRDGTVTRVGARRVPLAGVARLVVRSARSGYSVTVLSAPRGSTAHLLAVRPQSSEPHPGPTLALQLARRVRVGRVALAVRIRPGDTAARADE